MPAPISSARLGSGGVSIDVNFDIKSGIAQLRQDVSRAEKDMKATPKVNWDFQESAVRRGIRNVINKIEREAASIDVAFRLKDAGLLGAAGRAGALSPSQAAAAGYRPAPEAYGISDAVQRGRSIQQASVAGTSDIYNLAPLRAGYSGAEAAARNIIAAQVRSSRAIAAQQQAQDMASAMVYGPQNRPEGWMRAPIVGGHDTLERQAMASELHRIRRDTAKFNARAALFGEADESPLSQLAEAVKGRSAGNPAKAGGGMMGLASLARGGAYGYIAGQVLNGVSAYANYGTASIAAGSSNSAASLQGQLGQIQAGESIPVIGRVIKVFDELSRTSLKLQSTMRGEAGLREHAVAMADLSRNDVTATRAAGNKRVFDLQAEYDAQGVSTPASRAHIASVVQEERIKLERSQLLQREQYFGTQFQTGNISQAVQMRQPIAAQRAAIAEEGMREWRENKDPTLQNANARLNLQKLENFDTEVRRRRDLAQYNTDTIAMASALRVQNKGMPMEDEAALLAIRRARSNIEQATIEGGYKGRATLEGLAELRAQKAGLAVRGGGVVGATNLATDLVGDPYSLQPETQSRNRAGYILDAELRRIGGDRATDLSNRVNDRDKDPTSQLLQKMEILFDRLINKGGILLPG